MSNSKNLLSGSLQTIILNLLKEEKMYGYEITQKVKSLTNGSIQLTEGALYPALHKMEAEGLLETSTEFFENRVRKYYAITTTGLETLKVKVSETKSFIENIQILLKLNPKTS